MAAEEKSGLIIMFAFSLSKGGLKVNEARLVKVSLLAYHESCMVLAKGYGSIGLLWV
jgi:hypothetical protein